MLLAIDIGNTNTVMGVFEGDALRHSWRIKTDARNTADELALTFRGLLEGVEVTGIAACSTVPAVLRELRSMLAAYYKDVPTVLVEPGRTAAAVEDPGYPPLRAVLAAAGARVHPAPVDEEGLVVEALPPQAAIVCVTPSHQFPLGVPMSARRRLALLKKPGIAESIEWARAGQVLVDGGNDWPTALRRALGLLVKDQDDFQAVLAEGEPLLRAVHG